MASDSVEFKAALSAFRAATSRELRSLCSRGYSRRNAISMLLIRLCRVHQSPVTLEGREAPEVQALAKRARMSPEEAQYALIVQEQFDVMAEALIDPVARLQKLTRHLCDDSMTAPHDTAENLSNSSSLSGKAVAQTVRATRAAARAARVSSNDMPTEPSTSAASAPTCAGQAAATSVCSGPGTTRLKLSSGSSASAGSPSKGSCTPGGSKRSNGAKRSRKSSAVASAPDAKDAVATAGAVAVGPGVGTTDHDSEQKELSKQMQGLTGEINDAMRSGDRTRVALLMRQRDQLRHGTKRGRSSGVPSADAAGDKESIEPGPKRSRKSPSCEAH